MKKNFAFSLVFVGSMFWDLTSAQNSSVLKTSSASRAKPLIVLASPIEGEHSPEYAFRFSKSFLNELQTRDSLQLIDPVLVQEFLVNQKLNEYIDEGSKAYSLIQKEFKPELLLRVQLGRPEYRQWRVWWSGLLGKQQVQLNAVLILNEKGKSLVRKNISVDSLWWMPWCGWSCDEELLSSSKLKNIQVKLYSKLERAIADSVLRNYWPLLVDSTKK